ncbi:hypothetical protein AJ79_02511 [Helicocarpus griseus UAMH5409]|uniref:Calcineurin-like phosphoesterase domain-containing protein n=1 Tax=Helicocarpus griseus UAMH5409 TaxID=1447875 RepID=A0A2B7Y2C3_9EURO|nr:hypothetical protein AJ79_02511 [Helicocarpus griseus UAMH5409]
MPDNIPNVPRSINLPGQRQRSIASKLLHKHPLHPSPTLATSTPSAPPFPPLKIICISDTHNTKPALPPGDILIHAGDLTENGSFDELQSQLDWLSAQPHRYKVVFAGNHDVLLDEKFLEKYPERRYGDPRTPRDLNWGSIHYLENSSVTLDFEHEDDHSQELIKRTISVYGSPWTPQYGVSAFQHPRDEDVWTDKIPQGTDVVVVHGPPRFHLDKRHFHRAGCPLLGAEIAWVKPRLVVFGHIHVGYGREDVLLDRTRRIYEDVMNGWAGWVALAWMVWCILLARLNMALSGEEKMLGSARRTVFVNAAVVGGPENQLINDAVVVEL